LKENWIVVKGGKELAASHWEFAKRTCVIDRISQVCALTLDSLLTSRCNAEVPSAGHLGARRTSL
jgi:hypothetical protein